MNCLQNQCTLAEASQNPDRVERPFIGFMAVVAASALSGFAGVYFEKILKTTAQVLLNLSIDIIDLLSQVSVWMRNVQLAVCAVPIAVLTAYSADGQQLVDKGFFYGYDFVVWFA